MKKRLFLIISFLLLILPVNSYAADVTDKLYINMDLREDGSLYVQEIAVLSGEYNGRLRNVEYRNSDIGEFTGKKEDFNGSSIYNGSSITDLKVGSIADSSNITFNSFNSKIKYFEQVESASSGDSAVYEYDESTDGFDLKVYNPYTNNSAFYLSYVVNDVAVLHNDIAEVAWNVLGSSYQEEIDDLEVHVNLPKEDNDLRVWLHGDLAGTIKREKNKTAVINYKSLGEYNPVSFRLMFDKSIVPNATKMSNVDGKNLILEVEQEAADKANAIRENIRRQNLIIIIASCIWYVIFVLLFILFLKKKKKSQKGTFDIEYLREFPQSYGPEVVDYLNTKNISTNAFSASIMMLLEKKALKVDYTDEKNCIFIRQDGKFDLSESESKALVTIIDTIGDGNKVSLSEIKSYGKSEKKAKKLLKDYDEWKACALTDCKKYDFFMKSNGMKTSVIIFGLLSIIVTLINVSFETGFYLGYFAFVLGVGIVLYVVSVKLRTPNGVDDYKKWQALKKFMEDFGTMDEKSLPEVSLWGKYLVYAMVLGCADKLEKDMKIRIESMPESGAYYNYYYFHNRMFIGSSIAHSINSGVNTAVSSSRSTIAASQASSGSGFGGGASGGGGSFGGGGGGGRF